MLLLGLGWFEEGLRVVMAWLCSFIYKLVAGLFELFINISKVELLSSDQITPIYQRVTMVLTIIMVFYVTFELVKYILEPDKMKDKEQGASKIVVRMILVVVLIAFVPTAFSYAYKLQNALIEREVLSKVILGKTNISSTSFGRNFSADVFSLFYGYDKEFWGESHECDDVDCEQLVDTNINLLRTNGKLENITYALNETETKTENGISQQIALIRFDGIFAVLVGAFLIYVLVLYCIDLGVRVAQMTFLQIIAPIPIIGYLSPKKDNIFNKWVKQCITTYLDLFIRLSLIYFVLLVCKVIADAYNNGTLIQNVNQDSKTLVYIAIIMGLLLFAQKAPKMLQELFPKMGAASGNFGLKGSERVAPLAARAIGAGTGFTRAAIRAGVAKGKNIHNRNKDLKEKLRSERKPTDRKSMRQARSEARQNVKESNKQLKDKKNQLDAAEKEIRKAKKNLEIARKGTDQNKVDAEEAKLKKAQEKYDTLIKGSDKYKNYKAAEANKNAAETKLQSAQSKRQQLKEKYDRETDPTKKQQYKQDLINAIEEEKKADKEVAQAKEKFNNAETDFDTNNHNKESLAAKLLKEAKTKNNTVQNDPNATIAEKKAAETRLKKAQERYDLEQNNGYLGIKSENIDTRSALADERNQTYGTYAGIQAVGAAIRGGITGATAGVKAKKIGDVWKQSNEGVKKVMKREAADMQYLQDGGSATISGTRDRIVSQFEQKVGIKTQSEILKNEVKDAQDKIKLINSEAEKETQVKTFLDSAKQRSGSKLDAGEQKIFVDDTIEGIKMSDGTSISWQEASGVVNPFDGNYTTSTLFQSIRDQQNRATNEAESANQVYNEADANLAKIEADTTISEEDKNKERIRVAQLKEKRDKAAEEAEKKKTITQLARKKLLEYGVSKAIQGDRSDNILYDTIQSLRTAIDVSRRIPAARDHVYEGIYNNTKLSAAEKQKIWNAFINNNIQDYQDVDVIEGLLTNHVGMLKNQASDTKAQADKLSESSYKGAADAAAAGGSSSNK